MSPRSPDVQTVSASEQVLAAPFKWRGNKRRIGARVWERFGPVGHYTEPFLGGAGVLLARPNPTGLESVGDLDGLLVNFWRAVKEHPDLVTHHARFPPSDVDLHLRHAWLRAHRADIEALVASGPTACDPKAAAWWAWGQAHAYQQRWTDATHRPVLDPVPSGPLRLDGAELLQGLHRRLLRVAILRRDWTAVVHPPMLFRNKASRVAVFLDPPYEGDEGVYAARASVAGAVWDWAREHGTDTRLRIAVCGYDDGRATPRGWTVMPWSSTGGGARRALEAQRPAEGPGRVAAGVPALWAAVLVDIALVVVPARQAGILARQGPQRGRVQIAEGTALDGLALPVLRGAVDRGVAPLAVEVAVFGWDDGGQDRVEAHVGGDGADQSDDLPHLGEQLGVGGFTGFFVHREGFLGFGVVQGTKVVAGSHRKGAASADPSVAVPLGARLAVVAEEGGKLAAAGGLAAVGARARHPDVHGGAIGQA